LEAAAALTRVRRTAAAALQRAVQGQLAELALAKARFRVELPAARGAALGRAGDDTGRPLNPAGVERAEFRLAANPGEPLRPLRQTASGGELSRVMLALHVAAGDPANGRVVVFDEVDAGVGGAVADAVGSRLQRLARSIQLLCVTHLPQVAAYADRHFRVRKRVSRGRTHAGIANLSGSERVEELARMLGGKGPTPTSRRHASELLQAAGRARRGRVRSEA
jgi:DNA repair protein RecN (Recombination protein N)